MGKLPLVLTLAAAVLARAASAQPGAPSQPAPPAVPVPEEPPPQPAAPAPAPGDATPPDERSPKADPAYGDRPDRAVIDPNATVSGIRRGRDIVIRYRPDRSRANVTQLAILGASSLVFGAIGVYFNLEARSAADEVSARKFTGRVWTQERQDRYDDAHRDSTIAGVMYGVGGALLLTTAIWFMVTEPGQQELVITPNSPRPVSALVAPTRGGALVGGTWSF